MKHIGDFAEELALKQLARGDEQRARIADRETFFSHIRRIRTWFCRMTGVDSRECESLGFFFETLKKERGAGFVRETRAYRFADGTTFPADAYLPEGEGKAPAILFLCGHANEGRRFPDYVAAAEKFSSNGFFVLIADPIGQGERSAPPYWRYSFREEDAIYAHARMSRTERVFGREPCGIFYRDILHQLCALKNDSAADAERVGVAGHSGGGMQTAMLMLGGAPGVSAFAPSCYITDMRGMIRNRVLQDDEQIFRGMLKNGFDYCDMLLAAYPARVKALGAKQDFFPIDGFERSVSAAERVAARGLGQNYIFSDRFDIGHRYDEQMADATLAFFGSVLCEETKPLPPQIYASCREEEGQTPPEEPEDFDARKLKFFKGEKNWKILLFADEARQNDARLKELRKRGNISLYPLKINGLEADKAYSVGFDDAVFNSRAHVDNLLSLCGSSLAAATVAEIRRAVDALAGQFDEIAADGLVELCLETALYEKKGVRAAYLGNERAVLKREVEEGKDLSRYACVLLPGILERARDTGLFGF